MDASVDLSGPNRLIVVLLLTGTLLAPAEALAQHETQVRAVVGIQNVWTAFGAYSPSGRDYLHETYNLFGSGIDVLWKLKEGGKTTLRFGGGTSIFLGSYEPKNGGPSSSAGAAALEIRVLGELDYPIGNSSALVAQSSLSLLLAGGGKIASDSTYDDGIFQGVPAFSIAAGFRFHLKNGRELMLMYREAITSIEAWTDYTINTYDPDDEGASLNMFQLYDYFR